MHLSKLKFKKVVIYLMCLLSFLFFVDIVFSSEKILLEGYSNNCGMKNGVNTDVVDLRWSKVEDISYYTVVKNGKIQALEFSNSYTDQWVEAGKSYTYKIIGRYDGRNDSVVSDEITVPVSEERCAPKIITLQNEINNGRAGDYFSIEFKADYGMAPYSWQHSGGSLPNSLTLDKNLGVLSGILNDDGGFYFGIEVKDSQEFTDRKFFNLVIAKRNQPELKLMINEVERGEIVKGVIKGFTAYSSVTQWVSKGYPMQGGNSNNLVLEHYTASQNGTADIKIDTSSLDAGDYSVVFFRDDLRTNEFYLIVKEQEIKKDAEKESEPKSQDKTQPTLCIPNWQCEGWGQCVNNLQDRTCTDLNNCVVLTGKPSQSQPCTLPLSKPTAKITANPLTVAFGGKITISWTSTDAGNCVVSPDGWVSASGSMTEILTAFKTYTLKCSGAGGVATDSVTVEVMLQQQPQTAPATTISPVLEAGHIPLPISHYTIFFNGKTYNIVIGQKNGIKVRAFLDDKGIPVRDIDIARKIAEAAWSYEKIIAEPFYFENIKKTETIRSFIDVNKNLKRYETTQDILARVSVEAIAAVISEGSTLSFAVKRMSVDTVKRELMNPYSYLALEGRLGLEYALGDYKKMEGMIQMIKTKQIIDGDTAIKIRELYFKAHPLELRFSSLLSFLNPKYGRDLVIKAMDSIRDQTLSIVIPVWDELAVAESALNLTEQIDEFVKKIKAPGYEMYLAGINLAKIEKNFSNKQIDTWARAAIDIEEISSPLSQLSEQINNSKFQLEPKAEEKGNVLGAQTRNVVAEEKKLLCKVDEKLSERVSGEILLQVENKGEAWYVYPKDNKKYYLGKPQDAFYMMRNLGLGAKHEFINSNAVFPDYVAGKILLDVDDKGKAYYIYPEDKKAYYLGKPSDAFNVMQKLGKGITNTDLRKIDLGEVK